MNIAAIPIATNPATAQDRTGVRGSVPREVQPVFHAALDQMRSGCAR